MKNNRKKIAIVSDAIYPYNKGGKEKHIYEISTRLAKSGYMVTIYTMKWWKGKNIKKENGVTLHAISPLYPLYSSQRRSIKQAILFGINCFKLLNKNFDVIDVDHMPHLILFPLKLVCFIKQKKLTVTWNEVWGREYWVSYMGIFGNIAYLIELLSVHMADEIISISSHTTEKLKTTLHYKGTIKTISMGIDLEKIKNVKPSKQKSDVIFAGRLLSNKNIDVLIKSISTLKKKNPNIKCIIVGEGPEKNMLFKMVKNMHLEKNVEFINFLPDHTDLYALIKSSKVFVLPSTREGFGIVVLEANACNIPFITTKHKDNAAKDIVVNNENGKAIELSVPNFSKAIADFIKPKKIKKQYSIYVKNYDWDIISEKVEEDCFR